MKQIVLLSNNKSLYWNTALRGMQDAASALAVYDSGLLMQIELSDNTPDSQIQALNRYARHPDVAAVAISAIDADNADVAEAMRALKQKGVQVITVDSDVDRDKYRDARVAYIGTDNLTAGRALGRCAAGLRAEGGEYVAFAGRTNAQNVMDRLKGFAEGAGDKFKSDGLLADEHQEAKARENVRKAIHDHPDLHTLVGIWDYNGPTIADVVKDLNRKKDFTVVVFDADRQGLAQMGDGLIDAMMVQDPYQMGYQSVRLMKALVEKDQDTIKKMLPKLGEKDGDIYDTGMTVVVPDKDSPLKADVLGKKMEFMKRSDYLDWLDQHGL